MSMIVLRAATVLLFTIYMYRYKLYDLSLTIYCLVKRQDHTPIPQAFPLPFERGISGSGAISGSMVVSS
jgi:hypothetical protein